VVRVEDGARAADDAIGRVRRVALCNDCYRVGEETCPCGRTDASGPYWMGSLHDAGFVGDLVDEWEAASPEDLAAEDEVAELLDKLRVEAEASPFYMDIDDACKALKVSPPPRAAFVERLREAGIGAWQAQYGPNVLVHDGTHEEVVDVFERQVADR
jgi:tRNA G26 N,N-dimethylase Trm1